MPTYNMTQIIDKTLFCKSNRNIYKVSDIISLGDNAKPSFVMKKGESFIVDSYFLSSPAYKDNYNIQYAKRSNSYFLFYRNNTYYGVKIIDGAFDTKQLAAQGALTVAEQQAKIDEENKSGFESFTDGLKDLFKKIGLPILIFTTIIVLIIYVLPLLTKNKK